MAMQSEWIDQELSRGGVLPQGVAILIPAYNEAPHLRGLIAACRAVRPSLVLVVDDGSTDETLRLLDEVASDGDAVPVIGLANPHNMGKQATVKRGLQALALMKDVKLVALVDGDGQHDPAELPRLARLLHAQGADVLVGVRSQREMPPHRRLSNWLVNLGFRVLGGVDLFDVQSGLRLYRKPMADLLAERLPVEGGYGLEHESLALLATHAGHGETPLKVIGAPVSCAYGIAESKMRPEAMLQLALVTVQQALRLRRALHTATCAAPVASPGVRPARAMTVEIHDISPATFDEAVALGQALEAIGVDRPTLLVVPQFEDEQHRTWDLRQHGGLVQWLRARQLAGAEIVQHGLTHRAPAPPPRGVRHAMMHSWFSRGCAEFAHLDHTEAVSRLLTGRRILQECGLLAEGFIAPAWQQSQASIRALLGLGFRFTAFLNKVQPLVGGHAAVATPALTFAAPNAVVDYGKRAVMRGVEAWARPAPLLRVALHPEDLRGARPAAHAVERVRRLMRHRRLVTYSQWMAEAA